MTIDAAMKRYGDFVLQGVSINPKVHPDFTLGCLGLGAMGSMTEGGEAMDHIKKVVFHDKPLDRDKFILELGDHLWYLVLVMRTLHISWDDVTEANISKLVERYPARHPELARERSTS